MAWEDGRWTPVSLVVSPRGVERYVTERKRATGTTRRSEPLRGGRRRGERKSGIDFLAFGGGEIFGRPFVFPQSFRDRCDGRECCWRG